MRPGTRPDGSEKLRAVDDFTRSGCNPATVVTERLKYDSGDTFLALLRAARKHLGHDLCLWKADIDSAGYSRCTTLHRVCTAGYSRALYIFLGCIAMD